MVFLDIRSLVRALRGLCSVWDAGGWLSGRSSARSAVFARFWLRWVVGRSLVRVKRGLCSAWLRWVAGRSLVRAKRGPCSVLATVRWGVGRPRQSSRAKSEAFARLASLSPCPNKRQISRASTKICLSLCHSALPNTNIDYYTNSRKIRSLPGAFHDCPVR